MSTVIVLTFTAYFKSLLKLHYICCVTVSVCFDCMLPVCCRKLWAGCHRWILRRTFRHLAVLLSDVVQDKMLSSSFMILRYHICVPQSAKHSEIGLWEKILYLHLGRVVLETI